MPIGSRPPQNLYDDIGTVENPSDSSSPADRPIYVGPMSGVPPIGSVPIGAVIVVVGYPAGGRSRFYSNGTGWAPIGEQVLHFSKTQVVGIASISNQFMTVSLPIPKSFILGLNHLLVDFSVSKSGIVDIVTSNVYLGPTGTSADTLVLSTNVLSAASRQASTGMILGYRQGTDKLITSVQPGTPLGIGASSTLPYPTSQTAVLGIADQYFSLYMAPVGATDIPALERFHIRTN